MAIIVRGTTQTHAQLQPFRVDVPVNTKTDILLLSIPLTLTDTAWAAGAVLKAVAVEAGYTCRTVDLNMMTLQWLKHVVQASKIKDFFWYNKIDAQYQSQLDEYVNAVLTIIKQYQPTILGMSVFTDFSRAATMLIAKTVRQHLPHVRIVLGGSGVTNGYLYTPNNKSFGEHMKLDGLADHYILGDAEHSFKEFLKNNLDFPGIDNEQWQQLDNTAISNLSYPDYSDYNWSLYALRAIGITGSRGCVRKCTFCDYITTWKNYTWRTGDNIFEEMLYQKQQYKISYFQFSDSLINGNMKEYRRLTYLLSEYNRANPNDKIWWDSFFILRPKDQFGNDMWQLTAQSGCKMAIAGIESFNDATSFAMGKKFTNKDIDDAIASAIEFQVPLALLLFIGYVTDTQDIIDEAIKWLDEHQHVKQHFTLLFQKSMILIPGSWIEQNQKIMNIELIDPTNRYKWVNTKTGSTFEIREQWFKQVLDHAVNLGYRVVNESDIHKWLENMLLR